MARINFDDTVEAQPEFRRLLQRTGNWDQSLGMLLRFFRIAQKAWAEQIPITEAQLIAQDLSAMIWSGWAEPVEGGFHALGAAKHFAWLRQRRDAGVARALAPRNSNGQFASGSPAECGKFHQREPAGDQPLTPSLSLSKIQIQEEEKTEITLRVPDTADALPVKAGDRKKFKDLTRKKMQAFISVYAQGWKTKYGGSPEGLRDKAVIGKLGHWIESVSEERACELVQVYLQIDYRPFGESMHDLWKFFQNLNRIGVALDTGSASGQTDWSKVFGGAA